MVRKTERGGKAFYVIDFRYKDKRGVSQRYRKDAKVQMRDAAEAEAARLERFATEHGTVDGDMLPEAFDELLDVPAKRGVYFAFLHSRPDMVKIGWSNAIARRMAQLDRTMPDRICVAAIEPDATVETEAAYHRRFDRDRVRGEWFRSSPELVSLILQLRRAG